MPKIEKSGDYLLIGNDYFAPKYKLLQNPNTGRIILESINNQPKWSFLFSELTGTGGATYASLEDAVNYLLPIIFIR